MPYDPIQRHQAIEKIVVRESPEGQEKKYYRFRVDRWYGGVVTSDCVGCGLLCKFCWVSDFIMNQPAKVGEFYKPKNVAERLVFLAKKSGIRQLRVSGGEPTIGKPHLLQLLGNLQNKGYHFILETNGIPIAYDPNYAQELAKYPFLHVRVSLKGCNEEEFAVLTDAKPEGFTLQLKALENLVKAGVSCHPSVMSSFFPRESLNRLAHRLSKISPELSEGMEIEELILYPRVIQRLRHFGLEYYVAHKPNRVPQEQI